MMLQTIIKSSKERSSARRADLAERLLEIHPDLRVKPSKRAKRVALRLDSKNRVMNLVVPEKMNLIRAESFAQQHALWIAQRMKALPQTIPFVDGAVIPFLGRDITIQINYSEALKKTDIALIKNSLVINTNKEYPSPRIIRFLKKEALDTMNNLAREKAAEIGKEITAVSLRDTKSRWGSCSAIGSISLSWRLVFAPWEAMDYVIAHEVAHLIHMNHGKAFWAQCTVLSEDYSTGKKWMRTHGHDLMRYGHGE